MTVAYLWFNAAIYLVFGVLCTLQQSKFSKAQGFLELDSNGRAEYWAVYGGMEIGFAAFFAVCALKAELRGAGILFALCIYVGIVGWRMTSLMFLNDISATTKGIAVLEFGLLIAAILLFTKVIE